MSMPQSQAGFAMPALPPHAVAQQQQQQQLTAMGQGMAVEPSQQQSCEPPTYLHWFRLDALRLHDNPAFTDAVTCGMRFRAIFIIDPWFNANYSRGPGVNVWRFLLESLHDLDFQLQKMPFNTRLHVLVGQPTLVLPQAFERWNVKKLSFQASQVSYESMQHDSIVKMIGQEYMVEVRSFFSHTLYDPAVIIAANNGQVPITYKVFRQLLPIIGKPQEPLPLPSTMSVLNGDQFDTTGPEEPVGKIPLLQDLGFSKDEALYTNSWTGGETEALCRLFRYGTTRVVSMEEPVNWLVAKDSLSPYLRFGCLSPRQLFSQLQQFASISTRGQELFKQTSKNLLLRDFAFLVGSTTPKFDAMEGNPLCIQLPWDKNDEFLSSWREGRTGYPWVDAIIRQCRKDGWAHFLARQSIAVFLTRGYLWISWVLGKDFFHEYMLDFELPVSTVCWMQSSCSGFFCNQVESFDPCLVGKKMDMNGTFIKTYVPELRNFPSEYIHYPWKAPAYVQQQAQCIIGTHYPKPVVDVCEQGQLCCKRIQSIMSALHAVYGSK
jgi:cryptochrome